MIELLALALVPILLDKRAKDQQKEREKRLEELPELPYAIKPYVWEMINARCEHLRRRDVTFFRHGNRTVEVTTVTTFRIMNP